MMLRVYYLVHVSYGECVLVFLYCVGHRSRVHYAFIYIYIVYVVSVNCAYFNMYDLVREREREREGERERC